MIHRQVRLTAEQRREQIIRTGIIIANLLGVTKVTHRAIRDQINDLTLSGVKHHFASKKILIQAIVDHDNCPEDVKTEAKQLGLI
jgi:DNA-binding transcriptional regulator YbjK